MNSPIVSIIMPVYNAEKFIYEAAMSTLNQSYRDIELIVVDDGSTDNSIAKLSGINDERLRIIHQLNQGANVARNRGLAEARGEYVKFLDADDIFYPDAIEKQVKEMQSLGENEIVFGDFNFIDEDGKVYHENKIDIDTFNSTQLSYWILKHWDILTSTPMHRRSILMKLGGWDVRLKNHHETVLHMKMVLNDVKFVYKPNLIYGYRNYQAPGRISYERFTKLAKLNDVILLLDTIGTMLLEKYGTEASVYTDHLSQRFFTSTISYARWGKVAEANYCLKRCKQFNHTKEFPKMNQSHNMYNLFCFLTNVVGITTAYKITNKLSKILKMKQSGGKGGLLLGNKRTIRQPQALGL